MLINRSRWRHLSQRRLHEGFISSLYNTLHLVGLAICASLAGLADRCCCQAAVRPNIVFIFTDDQGWNDVGCYGSEIPTPNIDSLARDGLKLNQFYAASSICTPSRYGLLTGRYPTRSTDQLLGALMFLEEEDAERGLNAGETTYVSLLQQSGYRTALVGKWHLGHGSEEFWPTQHGFESFFGHTGGCVDFFTLRYGPKPDWYRGREIEEIDRYATDAITDEAVERLRAFASTAEPFYLHLAYNAPHFGKHFDRASGAIENVMQPKPSDLAKVPVEVTGDLRRDFAAKVVGLDQSIGRLLSELKQLGLADDTLVVFMTDHGGDPNYGGDNRPLRGGKATLYEGGIRVPCLLRWPGHIPPGEESNLVSCAIDCFPTFCSLAGIDKQPDNLDGVDLLPLLTQGVLSDNFSAPERELFWHTGKHRSLERNSWSALRLGNMKLVHPPGGAAELYDLSADPGEKRNLAGEQPAVVKALVSRTDKYLK